jgi:hypothetical protein
VPLAPLIDEVCRQGELPDDGREVFSGVVVLSLRREYYPESRIARERRDDRGSDAGLGPQPLRDPVAQRGEGVSRNEEADPNRARVARSAGDRESGAPYQLQSGGAAELIGT